MKRSWILLLGLVALPLFAQTLPTAHLAVSRDSALGFLEPPDALGSAAPAGALWRILQYNGTDSLPAPPSLLPTTWGQPDNSTRLLAEGRLDSSAVDLPRIRTLLTQLPEDSGSLVLRVYGGPDPLSGMPYMERLLPRPTAAEELTALDLPPWPAGQGGRANRWMSPEGVRPRQHSLRTLDPESTLDTLRAGPDVELVLSSENGHQIVEAELSLAHEAPPWLEMLPAPLPRTLSFVHHPASSEGAQGDLTLSWALGDDRLHDHFGIAADPRELRLFIESDQGWQLRGSEPVQTGQSWLFSDEVPLASLPGRWVIGVAGALELRPDSQTLELPETFTVHPVSPSPFNARASVRIDLPTSMKLRVTVYNLLGQRVARLHNGRLPAGRHAFTFSGGSLASGVYLLTVEAGPHRVQRKMVLLK